MKTLETKEKEKQSIHLTKVPDDIFVRVKQLANLEVRADRNVVLLLLRTALVDMQNRHCSTITEYMAKLNVMPTDTIDTD